MYWLFDGKQRLLRPPLSRCTHLSAGKLLVCEQQLTPAQLQAALSSACFIGVRLQHDPLVQPPPDLPSLIVAALAGSASELIALHGLPLLAPQQGHPAVTLAAFTRLRALTLRQATDAPGFSLRATDLPASLEDLTVFQDPDEHLSAFTTEPPLLNGFDNLRNLQRITLDHCPFYNLATARDGDLLERPAPLPPTLKVCMEL